MKIILDEDKIMAKKLNFKEKKNYVYKVRQREGIWQIYDYTVTKGYASLAAECKMLGINVYKLDKIFFERGY